MPRHFKVAEDVSPEDLEAFKNFIREKNYTRTTDECHEWLLLKGYAIGRTAVFNWIDLFRLEEKTRRNVEMSAGYLAEAAKSDPVTIARASIQRLNEKLMEWTFRDDESDAGEMMKVAISLKTSLGALLSAMEIEKRQAAAIAAGEQAAVEGKSGEQVVDVIKRAMGITA